MGYHSCSFGFLPVLTVAIVFAVGMNRVIHLPAAPRQIKAALIQPSIPQTMIWDEREAITRFHQVLDWSTKALAEQPKAQLLVWPEAAVPSLFLWDTNLYDGKTIYESITGLAREQKVWLIMGADDAEPLPGGNVNFYNSSFLINPEGEVLAKYRKRRLVIFGEYVPFSRWLPILSKMVQSQGEFVPGNQPVAFPLGSLNVITSVLICFEDVFPHLTREYVQPDTDFLLNLTNNGLTCWVDRRGGMHGVYFGGSKDIYKAGYKIFDIPVGAGGKYVPTFYRRYGDLFGWLCCGIAAIAIVAGALKRRAASAQPLGLAC